MGMGVEVVSVRLRFISILMSDGSLEILGQCPAPAPAPPPSVTRTSAKDIEAEVQWRGLQKGDFRMVFFSG